MADLVILAERNILKWLRNNGIKPKEFYTDLEQLKKRAVIFQNTRIVIIFSGACGLSRKKVGDFVDLIEKRIENPNDKGILSIDIMSDTKNKVFDRYMLYEDNPLSDIDVYNGESKIGENDDFLLELDYEKCEETQVFLKDNKAVIREELKEYKKGLEQEKDLRKLIKIPKIRFKEKVG